MTKLILNYNFDSILGEINLYFYNSKLIFLDICNSCFNSMKRYFKKNLNNYIINTLNPNNEFQYIKKAKNEILAYLNSNSKSINVDFEYYTTPFRNLVYQFILSTNYGETVSYKDIAASIGTKAFRAVGSAVANNPLPIIIPCHRVVSSKGIGGYSMGNGLKTKLNLIKIEKIGLNKQKRI